MAYTVTYKRRTQSGRMTTVRRRVAGTRQVAKIQPVGRGGSGGRRAVRPGGRYNPYSGRYQRRRKIQMASSSGISASRQFKNAPKPLRGGSGGGGGGGASWKGKPRPRVRPIGVPANERAFQAHVNNATKMFATAAAVAAPFVAKGMISTRKAYRSFTSMPRTELRGIALKSYDQSSNSYKTQAGGRVYTVPKNFRVTSRTIRTGRFGLQFKRSHRIVKGMPER